MNIIRKSCNKGFTLMEVLIAAALFVVLAAVATSAIIMGLRGQEFDRNVREAQVATRNALSALCDEMRSATTLPAVSGNVSAGEFAGSSTVPSGVIFPDAYGFSKTADGKGQDSLFKDPHTEAYYSLNKVIFTRPRTKAGAYDASPTNFVFDPSKIDGYVYVMWEIPAPSTSAGENPQNRIYRKIYKISANGPFGHMRTGGMWLVSLNYFSLTNSNLIQGAKDKAGDAEKDWIVAKLPGPNDIFELKVERAPYVNATGSHGAAITESPYGTSFERNVFKVSLDATVFRRGTKSKDKNKYTDINLQAQVRLQAGI